MTSEHVIFCPQKTEKLPKKHNEAGRPEQLLLDALSQIDYKHTIHCEDCLCQQTMQRAFWKNWVGVIAYGWLEDHPPPPNLPERKEEGSIKWWWKQNINLATWNIKTPYVCKLLGLTNNGTVWAWYSDLDKAWIALFCKIKILFKWVLYVDDQTILQFSLGKDI